MTNTDVENRSRSQSLSFFFSKCKVTDRQGMLQTLRGLYSFEKSHSILQIVSEDDFYEDDYIQIRKGFCDSNVFYYMMKRIPEWY